MSEDGTAPATWREFGRRWLGLLSPPLEGPCIEAMRIILALVVLGGCTVLVTAFTVKCLMLTLSTKAVVPWLSRLNGLGWVAGCIPTVGVVALRRRNKTKPQRQSELALTEPQAALDLPGNDSCRDTAA